MDDAAVIPGLVLCDTTLFFNDGYFEIYGPGYGNVDDIYIYGSPEFSCDGEFFFNSTAVVVTGTLNVLGDVDSRIDNRWLIGPDAVVADFDFARMIVTNGDTGYLDGSSQFAIIAESVGVPGDGPGVAIAGVGATSGTLGGFGVNGIAYVSDTADAGAAIGGFFTSAQTHAGGNNVGVLLNAVNGANNYAINILNGDVKVI